MNSTKPAIFADTCYTTGTDVSINELLSYKQQAKIQLQLKPSAAYQQLAGNYLANIKGRGMEFAEVRHYQPGDDVRAIDWAVTARTGKAHTKLFQEEKERPTFILLDLSDSMIFGSRFAFKSVQASHLAALLSWQAKQRNDRLGGIVFNQSHSVELKPSGRTKGLMRFIDQIQQHCVSQPFKSTTTTQSLFEQLKRLSHIVQTGSQVHLISDFSQLDENCQKLLNQMRHHNQISIWQITDPLELMLPATANKTPLKVSSLSGSGFFKQKDALLKYQYAATERLVSIADAFMKLGMPVHQISASTSLLEQFNARSR